MTDLRALCYMTLQRFLLFLLFLFLILYIPLSNIVIPNESSEQLELTAERGRRTTRTQVNGNRKPNREKPQRKKIKKIYRSPIPFRLTPIYGLNSILECDSRSLGVICSEASRTSLVTLVTPNFCLEALLGKLFLS